MSSILARLGSDFGFILAPLGRPKAASRGSHLTLFLPKSYSTTQDGLKTLQDAPKTLQDPSKMPQEAPRTAQVLSKTTLLYLTAGGELPYWDLLGRPWVSPYL